MVNSSSQFV